MIDELLTIEQVANILKVHKSHIFRLIKDGELATVKRGTRYTRILESDLVAFIERYRKEARPAKEAQR